MGSRSIGVAIVAALLATAGLAAAQQASFTVTLEPQGEAGELSPGQASSVSVEVRLEGDGFSCAEDEELPVELSASGSGGVTGTADPSEIVFSNTMGVHSTSTPAGGYNESEQATVTVQAGTSSGTHDVTLTGTFPGGSYGPPDGSCSGEFPSAEGTANIPVTVQADDTGDGTDGTGDDGTAGDDTDGGGTNDGGNATDGGEDDNGIPLGPWMAPLAFVGAALALRRS